MNNFQNKLKSLRKERKLTQKQLADQLGLGVSTISMYEHGEREPDLHTLEAIAKYFSVDMNYLMGCPEQARPVTEEEIKFALFGGDTISEITDEMYEDVKHYAQFLKEKKEKKRGT